MSENKAKISARFNAESNGDVIFSSSDGVLFHLHKKNLELCSGGFPSADTPTDSGEIVLLSETAATLELLFPFVYPQRYPGLNDMHFNELLKLAESAEKYEVYFAMSLCSLKMKEYVSTNAPEIFGFAAKHDYPFLIALVAPLLVNRPLTHVVNVIPQYMYIPWTLYKERWQQCADSVCSKISTLTCGWQTNHQVGWFRKVMELEALFRSNVSNLTNCDSVFGDLTQNYCHGHCSNGKVTRWRELTVQEIKKVPDFVSFLKQHAPVDIKGK